MSRLRINRNLANLKSSDVHSIITGIISTNNSTYVLGNKSMLR